MNASISISRALAAVAAAGLAATASAQWSDDFDSYTLGSICGQGGWQPWGGDPSVCANVSDAQARSGTQSLRIQGSDPTRPGDDVVQLFDETRGQWTFTIWSYVPSNASGQAMVILLNTYPATVNQNWSVVLGLDATLGMVVDWPSTPLAALETDRWAEVRVEIDLDNDTADYFYDQQHILGPVSWQNKVSFGGEARIHALDMYGGEPGSGGSSGAYFDDASLVPDSPVCYPDCDGNSVLDFFDFLCFQNAFLAGDPYADCDGNTVLDFFDFLCFQNEFLAGCP